MGGQEKGCVVSVVALAMLAHEFRGGVSEEALKGSVYLFRIP